MDRRFVSVLIVLLAVCAMTAIDASRLKTRIRAPPSMPASGSMSSLAQSEASAPVGSVSASAPVPVASESGSMESIAATKLLGENSNSACENSCGSTPIRWGSVGSSSSSSNSDSNSDLPSVDDVVGPIASWIKAFKKRIGGGDDLASTAKAIVKPLVDKLRQNQHNAQEKLEESNEAILDTVERSVTSHVLKLLKAEKISEVREEQSEAKKARAEAARDEQSEREYHRLESSALESLSASISKAVSEHSQSH